MGTIVRLLASLGPVGVGIVFLLAALAKLVAPSRAHTHLYRLGMPANRWTESVPAVLGTGEAVLGAALVSGVAPAALAPATVGLLAGLAGVTIWGTRTERTSDCGCYGGLVEVRPEVSVLLNAGYAGLMLLGWRAGHPLLRSRAQQATVVSAVGAGAAVVAMLGEWRRRTTGKPLVDLRPLRPGKRWNRRWLPAQADALATGEQIVVFMGEHCPTCKLWILPLNKINARADLPPVVGVMGSAASAVAAYAQEHGITFPVVAMAGTTFAHLTDVVPTIAVLRDGTVQSVDEGQLPPAMVERVKQAMAARPRLPDLSALQHLQATAANGAGEPARA